MQQTQRILPGPVVSGDLTTHPEKSSYMLGFKSTAIAGQPISAAITFQADRVYFESEKGWWNFHFGLKKAGLGSVRIRNLPVGATAWLFDESLGGKIIGSAKGDGGPAILASLVKLHNPRLVIIGAKAETPEPQSVVKRFGTAVVEAALFTDSSVEARWRALDATGDWVMPVLNTDDSFIGFTDNTSTGNVRFDYADAYLEPRDVSRPASYRVLYPDKSRTATYLQFPLGHIHRAQRITKAGHYASVEGATYTSYAPLTIELPGEKPALAEVLQCKGNWTYSSRCEITRTLLSESQQQGRRLVVNLLEPVVNTEVVLRVYLAGVTIGEPATTKQLGYELYHFWHFGDKPAWAFWTITLLFLLLSVIAVILFVTFTRRRKEAKLARRREAEQKMREDEILRFIRLEDPEFDIAAFCRRGREIATRIQHSWSAGDMRDCRRFLSQGVYNRFRLQLTIMREIEQRRNVMADFRIKNFYVLTHNRSGEFDCLTVRLEAEARDAWVPVNVSEAEAQKAAERAPLNSFVEFYSFMRRSNARSDGEQPLANCSHCGTPFPPEGETNKCKSCGAVMGSGEFDWVLAEITQESEYRGYRGNQELAGGLSPDRLEDRASYVFWRDIMARLTGDANFIRRDATDGYLHQPVAKQLLHDIAVGAVDTQSVEGDSSPKSAQVLVKWSAADSAKGLVRHRRSILTLIPHPEQDSHTGFADPGCPSCGAPLPETDSEECAYCLSTIARKNRDWLLDHVETTVE